MAVGFRNLGLALLLLLAAGIAQALYLSFTTATTTAKVPVSSHTAIIGPATLTVEIANTPELQAKGLGGRDSLSDGSGMLFVFGHPGKYGFWMKDMRFAIDIVWINSDKKIVGITDSVSPETFPSVFYPPSAVSYALEIPAGYATKAGLEEGNELLLQ